MRPLVPIRGFRLGGTGASTTELWCKSAVWSGTKPRAAIWMQAARVTL